MYGPTSTPMTQECPIKFYPKKKKKECPIKINNLLRTLGFHVNGRDLYMMTIEG